MSGAIGCVCGVVESSICPLAARTEAVGGPPVPVCTTGTVVGSRWLMPVKDSDPPTMFATPLVVTVGTKNDNDGNELDTTGTNRDTVRGDATTL